MTRPEQQQALDAISRECKTSRQSFDLQPSGDLYLQFNPTDKFEAVDCALGKLKELNVTNMGFLGNEAYHNESN